MKAEADKEQMQRITEEKKAAVHDELIRKSAMKEVSEPCHSYSLIGEKTLSHHGECH